LDEASNKEGRAAMMMEGCEDVEVFEEIKMFQEALFSLD
jgi:hypothetical protein